ncbi:MAG TPA: 30S ribosomal protein S2 [Lentisphaeria bacterium]|nr:MAG: 30S ribosomal protein S2 [Lentisphaerae bacterium GWF2_50_93]HCE42238.1 30S ribosomal protein S2 [Lentisphaeria bacterium]
MAKLTIKDLMEAGVHFGHQTKRWNPKMKDYVFGEKNGIYIIDLTKTMRQIAEASNFLQKTVMNGGNILFVGTKRQSQEVVKEAAIKTGMFHVTERWLGGTLTNNATIQKSVTKMLESDVLIANPDTSGLKKKELSSLNRDTLKQHKNLDGIVKMKKLPAALVVVDICKEEIAVREAMKLKIPVVAIVDTNADIDQVEYPIVANDDAVRSIKVIVDVLAESISYANEIYQRSAGERQAAEAAENAARQAEQKDAPQQKRPPRRGGQGGQRRDGGGQRRDGGAPHAGGPRKAAAPKAAEKKAAAPAAAAAPAKEGEVKDAAAPAAAAPAPAAEKPAKVEKPKAAKKPEAKKEKAAEKKAE